MSMPLKIGIVSLSSQIRLSDLLRVSAAIQKQVNRDFAPIWNVQAMVAAFEQLADVPLDYWCVMIVENDPRLPANAGGIHLDSLGQPFSLVRAQTGWGFTTSHEVLEMLADPFGNRLIAGESPSMSQGRVQFLLEVCDPSEAVEFGYTVDGILVSDFYTPQYFDPVAAGSVRYSYTGAVSEPRQVLPGGYLSWNDPTTNEWSQLQYFDSEPVIVNLGVLNIQGNLRASIERITNVKSQASMLKSLASSQLVMAKRQARQSFVEPNHKPYEAAGHARAQRLLAAVEMLMDGPKDDGGKPPKLRRAPRKRK